MSMPGDLRWCGTLVPGERVEFQVLGNVTGTGVVDAFMPDGSVVWLWLDQGLGRVMILAGECFFLRRAGNG